MASFDACGDFCRKQRLSRREVLSIGAAAAFGLSLPDLLRYRQVAAASEIVGSFGAARSIIFIFLHGGHPQHETWDPKPQAPVEVRGEFGDMATAVPGLRISELFPRCARIADRLSIIRSMSHDNPNHVQACLPAMTGHAHPRAVRGQGDFPPSPNDFPHFGAVYDYLHQGPHELPNWVQLGPLMTRNNGTVLHGQSPGFLGRKHSPFIVDQDLLAPDVRIHAVTPRIGVRRMTERRRLLSQIEAQQKVFDRAGEAVKDSFYQRAYNLLSSSKTGKAFDLAAEPPAGRDRYPLSQIGQCCLLARRLVEAGVPIINIHWCKTPKGSWDTHSGNFAKMKNSLAPALDQCFATLVEDLEDRGLLDEVLVVPLAEFGRTPTINKNAGRDHWPSVYSLAIAGAGLQRGAVYGASDRLAAYPDSTSHNPADFAATIYHLLGVPAETILYDQDQRPHQLVIGKRIEPLLA